MDGFPYLALGIQFNFQNCDRVEGFDYLFKHAARMGCNTIFFAPTWNVLEKTEGKYDWRILDHALKRCRQHGLRMVMLWFGSKQGEFFFKAPDWIRNDKGRFPRVVDADGNEKDSLCLNGPGIALAEKRAFDATLKHLAKVDGRHHTVIMIQMENEPCWEMFIKKKGKYRELDQWMDRCHCGSCNDLFARVGGNEWEFGVRTIVRHLNGLLAGQKRMFPVPTYANFAINPLRTGNDIDIYLDECPGLDFVAPDFYGYQQGDLGFTMRYFSRGRNLPFMAECATELVGNSPRNLYLCVLEHGAQGFDPWAIDFPFGFRIVRDQVVEKPPVDRHGRWSDMAILYGRALRSLRNANRQIAAALGSEDIMHYVSQGPPLRLEERRWGIFWRFENGQDGKWVLVRTGRNELTLTGTDGVVTATPIDGKTGLKVEEGLWVESRWEAGKKVAPRTLEKHVTRPLMTDRNPAYEMDLDDGRTFRIQLEGGHT